MKRNSLRMKWKKCVCGLRIYEYRANFHECSSKKKELI